MKKKVEKFCRINDEKLEKDIQELQCYVNLLEERLRQVEDPNLYRKMKKLDRDARLMIHDLKNMSHENRALFFCALFSSAPSCAIILNMKTLYFH